MVPRAFPGRDADAHGIETASSGVLVINDAYNANPASMAAAIETLA